MIKRSDEIIMKCLIQGFFCLFFFENLLECECFSGGVIGPPLHLHSLVLPLGVVTVVNQNLICQILSIISQSGWLIPTNHPHEGWRGGTLHSLTSDVHLRDLTLSISCLKYHLFSLAVEWFRQEKEQKRLT